MNDKSHIWITETAIKKSGINFTDEQIETLKKFSLQPDYDEAEYFYSHHFYNPTREYKENETTALTKFISHYEKAKGKRNIEELGRSIHFLEDLCTPVHCGYNDKIDYVYRLKQHIEFEKMCDSLLDKIDIPSLDFSYYLSNSLEVVGKKCAAQSYVYFKELDKKSTDQKMIGERAILLAVETTTGILKRGIRNEF